MAQGQLGLYGPFPAEIQPAAQRVKARVYDSGPDTPRPAEHDLGSEEERAAGGAGPGVADPGRARSLIGMAEVHGYTQWTSRESAGGVMNRLRCGRSSDSDGWRLHTAGPGQLAGPPHSTAPDGARRGTRAGRGWAGLKAETCGGPGRAGPRSKMYRWVSVTSHLTGTELLRSQRFATLLYKD
jgi:hypothetical protein